MANLALLGRQLVAAQQDLARAQAKVADLQRRIALAEKRKRRS